MADTKTLTEEQMHQLGLELTPVAHLPYLCGVGEDVIISELENPFSTLGRAYYTGVAETARQLRKQNIDAAMAGSPASIVAAIESVKQCKVVV